MWVKVVPCVVQNRCSYREGRVCVSKSDTWVFHSALVYERLKPELMMKHGGGDFAVAIHPETGEHFDARSKREATEAFEQKYPDGVRHTYLMGSPPD